MIHRFHISLFMPLALCLLSLLPLSVRAQTQAFDFVPGATRYDFTIAGVPSWIVGYQFKVAGDVTVYNLGFYDSGLAPLTYPGNGTATSPDGFTASHAVGIFDYTTGNLLVQTIVPQNSTLLDSNFRYAEDLEDGRGNAITGPYILPARGTYIIVGVSNGENFTYVQNAHDDLTHDFNVAYLHSVYQAGNTLLIPNIQDAAAGYFGPNFTTSSFAPRGTPTGSSTPEPGPAAFAICASVAGLLWRVKRLRSIRCASC